MLSKKLILALCCAIGVALPLAVKAQLPKPTTPDSNPVPSSGDMPTPQPSSPPDLGAPPSPESSTPPASVPTTPAPGDVMPPSEGNPTPPASGEPTPLPTSKPNPIPKKMPKKNSLPSVQGGSGKSTGKVDINSATLQEMVKVKGITASDAKKIITNRPYSSLNDLVTKKVLTQGQLSQVKSKLSF